MRGRTVDNLREALSLCGYDLDEIIRSRTRKRTYVDLRSIVWTIYQHELARNTTQISRAFGWSRDTVQYGLMRANHLMKSDRTFRDMYDAIYGHYMAVKSAKY